MCLDPVEHAAVPANSIAGHGLLAVFFGAGDEILDRNRVARIEPGIFGVPDLLCLVEHSRLGEPLQKRIDRNRLRMFSALLLHPRWRWHNFSMVDFHGCDSVRYVTVLNNIA